MGHRMFAAAAALLLGAFVGYSGPPEDRIHAGPRVHARGGETVIYKNSPFPRVGGNSGLVSAPARTDYRKGQWI